MADFLTIPLGQPLGLSRNALGRYLSNWNGLERQGGLDRLIRQLMEQPLRRLALSAVLKALAVQPDCFLNARPLGDLEDLLLSYSTRDLGHRRLADSAGLYYAICECVSPDYFGASPSILDQLQNLVIDHGPELMETPRAVLVFVMGLDRTGLDMTNVIGSLRRCPYNLDMLMTEAPGLLDYLGLGMNDPFDLLRRGGRSRFRRPDGFGLPRWARSETGWFGDWTRDQRQTNNILDYLVEDRPFRQRGGIRTPLLQAPLGFNALEPFGQRLIGRNPYADRQPLAYIGI